MTQPTIDHYVQAALGPKKLEAALSDRIAQLLIAAGHDLNELTSEHLAPIDEFHIRGPQATRELASAMRIRADDHVLDVGSGLGGPARYLAQSRQCRVTGIDLTPAFTHAAQTLTAWLGLEPQLQFQTGDATDMPFDDGHFDAAMSLHVGMNIAAKDRLYQEIRRVLKPGRIFGIYDVLQGEGGDVVYPVPWAGDASISHLVSVGQLVGLLEARGFAIQAVMDSTKESDFWFAAMVERWEAHGVPSLSFQTFLGDAFLEMANNLARNLRERRVRTVTLIARSVAM